MAERRPAIERAPTSFFDLNEDDFEDAEEDGVAEDDDVRDESPCSPICRPKCFYSKSTSLFFIQPLNSQLFPWVLYSFCAIFFQMQPWVDRRATIVSILGQVMGLFPLLQGTMLAVFVPQKCNPIDETYYSPWCVSLVPKGRGKRGN